MEFRIENEEKNIKVELIDGENKIAKATCYFKDTPKVNEKEIGCIGEFEAETLDAGTIIIKKCEEILKEQLRELKYNSSI